MSAQKRKLNELSIDKKKEILDKLDAGAKGITLAN